MGDQNRKEKCIAKQGTTHTIISPLRLRGDPDGLGINSSLAIEHEIAELAEKQGRNERFVLLPCDVLCGPVCSVSSDANCYL